MTTNNSLDYVDQNGSIVGGSSCIEPSDNERRVAIHAPSGLDTSSLANINSVNNAGDCNASLSPPGVRKFTVD
jgi:hypothetical protein